MYKNGTKLVVVTTLLILWVTPVLGADVSTVILVNQDYSGCWGSSFEETLGAVEEPLCAAAFALAANYAGSGDTPNDTTFGEVFTYLGEMGYDGVIGVAVGSDGTVGVSFYGSGVDSCASFQEIAEIDPTESLLVQSCTNEVDPEVYQQMLESVGSNRVYVNWEIVAPLFSVVIQVEAGDFSCWCDSFEDLLSFVEDPLVAAAYSLAAIHNECQTSTYEDAMDEIASYLQDSEYQGVLDLVVDADGLSGVAFYGSGPSSSASIIEALEVDPEEAGELIAFDDGTDSNVNAGVILRDGLRAEYLYTGTRKIAQRKGISAIIIVDAFLPMATGLFGSMFNAYYSCYEDPISAGAWWIAENWDGDDFSSNDDMNLAYEDALFRFNYHGWIGDVAYIGSHGPHVCITFTGWPPPNVSADLACTRFHNGALAYDASWPANVHTCTTSTTPYAAPGLVHALAEMALLEGSTDLVRWDWVNLSQMPSP